MNENELNEIVSLAKAAVYPGYPWDIGIETVVKVWALSHTDTATTLKLNVRKAVEKYVGAYKNRPSVRKSNPVGTIPDLAISTIIRARLFWISPEDVEKVVWGHRLAMSAENVLGLMLEEYLSISLAPFGWYCCWGNMIKAADFCALTEDNKPVLLQVKNRSNTENSSSSAIRAGTDIKHWFRVHAKYNSYHWDDLCRITGCSNTAVSERGFREYIENLVHCNPDIVPIEHELLRSLPPMPAERPCP